MTQGTPDRFSQYSPWINMLFFVCAVVFGMIFLHPAYLLASVFFSAAYYICLARKKAWKLLVGLLPVFAAVSLLNPLFNLTGEHVLFTLLGRPYTREALFYGMATAAMLVSVLLWFACYNAVMSSDKIMYLFGRVLPGSSMLFTMVLRLFPNFKNKVTEMAGVRKCIGKGMQQSRRARIQEGITVVSCLTGWALEGAVITGDSMRSRGYSATRRTSFAVYRFTAADRWLLGVMLFMACTVTACAITGATAAAYTPQMQICPVQGVLPVCGILFYCLFLCVPTVVSITQALVLHRQRARIGTPCKQ